MGQRFILTDDLDESIDAVGQLSFFKEGQEYEIDLGAENMKKYTKLLEAHKELLEFLADHGRPVRRQAPLSAPRGRSKDHLDAIRRWARANGHEVSDRGRIPEKVIDAYETRSRMPETPQETTNEVPKGDDTPEVVETPQTPTEAPKGIPAAQFSAEMGEVLSLTPPTRTNKSKAKAGAK